MVMLQKPCNVFARTGWKPSTMTVNLLTV